MSARTIVSETNIASVGSEVKSAQKTLDLSKSRMLKYQLNFMFQVKDLCLGVRSNCFLLTLNSTYIVS